MKDLEQNASHLTLVFESGHLSFVALIPPFNSIYCLNVSFPFICSAAQTSSKIYIFKA